MCSVLLHFGPCALLVSIALLLVSADTAVSAKPEASSLMRPQPRNRGSKHQVTARASIVSTKEADGHVLQSAIVQGLIRKPKRSHAAVVMSSSGEFEVSGSSQNDADHEATKRRYISSGGEMESVWHKRRTHAAHPSATQDHSVSGLEDIKRSSSMLKSAEIATHVSGSLQNPAPAATGATQAAPAATAPAAPAPAAGAPVAQAAATTPIVEGESFFWSSMLMILMVLCLGVGCGFACAYIAGKRPVLNAQQVQRAGEFNAWPDGGLGVQRTPSSAQQERSSMLPPRSQQKVLAQKSWQKSVGQQSSIPSSIHEDSEEDNGEHMQGPSSSQRFHNQRSLQVTRHTSDQKSREKLMAPERTDR